MSEVRLLASAVLLAGGVAAAVSAVTVRLAADETPRVASVRLGQLAADHAARAVRSDGSPEETARTVRAWALALEDALAEVAAGHRVVLLPARAVAAGAPDLTPQVEASLARTAAKPAGAAGQESRP